MRPAQEHLPWITAPELARWANVSPMTARTWIERYRLGRKVGGRWRADLEKAREFLGCGRLGAAARPHKD